MTFEDETAGAGRLRAAAAGLVAMLLFRWVILLLLLGAAVCFAFYAGTGEVRFRR